METIGSSIEPKLPTTETTPNTEVLPPPESVKSHPKLTVPLIVLGFFLIFSVAATAYWWGTHSLTPSLTVIPTPAIQPLINIPETTSVPTEPSTELPSTSGITWYTSPKSIASLSLFKLAPTPGDNYFESKDAKFYEVGTQTDGTKIINAYISVNAPGGEQFLRLLVSKDNQITVIIPNSDSDWLKDSLTQELDPNIKISTAVIAELEPPATLTAKGLQFDRYYYSGTQFDEKNSPVKITTTVYGDIYRIDNNLENSLAVVARQIILRLKDNTIVPYTLKSNLYADDKAPQINWTDADYQQSDFTQNFLLSGCGSSLFATVPIVKNIADLNGKVMIGKSSTNQDIYKITDPTNPLAQSIYSIYREGLTIMEKSGDTPEVFTQKPTHFIWQDPLGDWQVFINQSYIPAVECAKPVIYLYPLQTTTIQVAVGAKIRQSDPVYPPGGWQVVAQPNGTLTYLNQTYPSLFWDGLGNGPYPDYRQYGTVVSQSNLITILKHQLSQLGLTTRESYDFLAFWQAKLPTTPYIRLTWLGTADMERLAPLTVNPTPDTRIRLFLEFEGLNQPTPLKPQTLSAPARRGFTLVEWGGLLINSSK